MYIYIYVYIWMFPKMVVPNNHGFPTKNDHFGVFCGWYHLGNTHITSRASCCKLKKNWEVVNCSLTPDAVIGTQPSWQVKAFHMDPAPETEIHLSKW